MTLRSQISIVLALTAILGGGWYWLTAGQDAGTKAKASKASSATPVLVEALTLADDKVVVRAIGTGEARRSASIYPSVPGEVMEIGFESGQWVRKGAALVRLDDRHQRLAVKLAEVALAEAQRQVERLQRLVPRGAASVAQLETAQTDMQSAQLKLEQARTALADRTVNAPFDGITGMTDIDRGDRVSDQTMITTLDDRTAIQVDFTLPEEYAGRVKVGDTVTVRPWTAPDLALVGTIAESGSRIDPVSRSMRVKARVDNSDLRIKPGASLEVQIAFTGRAYPSIPEVAVLWSRDGAYVWRVDGDRTEKVFVKIVRRERGRILVDGALREGDKIVVEGVQGLRVNQKVKTAPYKPHHGAVPERRASAAPTRVVRS